MLNVSPPIQLYRVIDLVKETGADVSDWSNYGNKANKHASQNPRYCYNWSFLDPQKVLILCLWHDELQYVSGKIYQYLTTSNKARSKARAEHIAQALNYGTPVRAIILWRKADGSKNVHRRALDPEEWHIEEHDLVKKCFKIVRGKPKDVSLPWFPEEGDVQDEGILEGQFREAYIRHRTRERNLRIKKLEDFKRRNGRIYCEIRGCKFDFEEKYGVLGKDFAEVHHLEPLGNYPSAGKKTKLSDLAVVCANCHRMIHRKPECIPPDELIPVQS